MNTITQDFTLAEPQVTGPLAVFPVLGPEPRLGYLTFAEASELGAFVKERDGGASVGTLVVHNPTDSNVLVYEGEEVLGAQQNRSFDIPVLVGAGSSVSVPVSCVEEGRWDSSRHDEHFHVSPQSADPTLRRRKRNAANVSAAAGGPVRADQGEVWDHVRTSLGHHYVGSPSSAMSDVFAGRRGDLDALLEPIRPLDGQVGAIAEIGGLPVALDLVSQPRAFATLLPRLARGYALDALGRPEAEADREPAARLLHEALAAVRVPQPTPGLGRGFGLVTTSVSGSGLELEDELVQLCAFPTDDSTPRGPSSMAARVARPSQRRRRRRR